MEGGWRAVLLTVVLLGAGCAGSAVRAAPAAASEGACAALPAIAGGYGADGPFRMEMAPPAGEAPPVFLPADAPGRRPVVFLAHGYGPNRWEAYRPLIAHLASRGMVVVFGRFAMTGGNAARYADLWAGFLAAARRFGDRMDLSRVGFVGHSFGGGAIPALARKGLLEQGWGGNGAFTFIMAPWYVLEAGEAELPRMPPRMMQAIQVYEDDRINDHRMAVDLFRRSRVPGGQYFFELRSVPECGMVADHATPGRNPSLALKRLGVFRPLDALAEAAFGGPAAARTALAEMGRVAPLVGRAAPEPARPESAYRFRWDGAANPRRGAEPW